jgi:hypothetical protein
MFEEEIAFFAKLITSQLQVIRGYRKYAIILIIVGACTCMGAVLWVVLHKLADEHLIDIAIKGFLPFGIGLMTLSASTYPLKEIASRKDKILIYEDTISVLQRLSIAKKKSQDELKNIKSLIKEIREAIATRC